MTQFKLYSWGANSHGQLGLGFKSEQELISEVELPLDPKDIKEIKCGARHSIILSKNGEIFISGKNELNENECKFKRIDSTFKFSYIACGWDVNAALSFSGELFVWGNNSSNQLGYKKESIKFLQKLTLPDNEIVKSFKFGLKYMAILTMSNHILITGSLRHFRKHAENYQVLHHNSVEWLRVNTKTDNDIITDYACGQNHLIYVIRNHILCSIGDNKFGQCGNFEIPDKIVKLESGWTHNGFLTVFKQLFLFGRNNHGQCGCKSSEFIVEPQKCSISPVEQFSIGSEHCIILSEDDIYTFGWNEHRNCGHDTDDDILIPTKLPISIFKKQIHLLATGAGFCMVLLEVR
ncbi:hypothetical protein PVAND_007228 [Polypedilum vanderplanki]|uniref:RCC1-like domain-containing protein n=1 Tax=Polypedilum vanderplanki TaxID=319348 RepID=A0A9J6C768_POLVA|nr:hypothetical protein PVAND_007228 [Polypedilum vanderplanki]